MLLGAIGILSVAVLTGFHLSAIAPSVLVASVFITWHRVLLRWTSLLGAIHRRHPVRADQALQAVQADLPFDLEPYRSGGRALCWSAGAPRC